MESIEGTVQQNITKSSDNNSSSEFGERLERKSDSKLAKRRYERSSSTDSERRLEKKERKKIKKQKKEKKRKKKKSKHRGHTGNMENSSSSSDEDAPRSVITGKKIKMHVEKTKDDVAQEKMRRNLLRFMNSSI
jgi:hypothetical protein